MLEGIRKLKKLKFNFSLKVIVLKLKVFKKLIKVDTKSCQLFIDIKIALKR